MLRSLAGGRLFGRATGTGAPDVLALHGWARTHRDFDAVLSPATPAGAAGSTASGAAAPGPPDGPVDPPLDALALDLPGFGVSPAPPQAWGSADYADCVAAVLADMATPVVVLGHSFGGRVALHLAAGHPDQVRGLVLTGVPQLVAAPPRRPPLPFRTVRRLHRWGLVGDRRMEAARQRYGSADYRAAQGVMRQVLVRTVAERYDDVLAAIACPVVLVWGDNDTAAPLSMAEEVAERLPRAELVVCPGAGHLTPLSVPDQLRRAVRQVQAAGGPVGKGGR